MYYTVILAWRCYGTFSSLLYSAMRFYSGFRHVCYIVTGSHRMIPVDKIKKRKTNKYKKKKGEIHCGRERREKIDVLICVPPSCNVYFRFVAHEHAQSHIFSFFHWHLHCTFPCVVTNTSYIKRIYFMYKKETVLWINAWINGTIVIKDSCAFLSGLVIDNREKLGSHQNVA